MKSNHGISNKFKSVVSFLVYKKYLDSIDNKYTHNNKQIFNNTVVWGNKLEKVFIEDIKSNDVNIDHFDEYLFQIMDIVDSILDFHPGVIHNLPYALKRFKEEIENEIDNTGE